MVLISAEQMARRLLGRATWPVMLLVGLSAYSLSAWHTVLLLRAWGEPWPLQITGAVAVDGLAVGSVWALYVAGRTDAAPDAVRPDARASTLDGQPTPAPSTPPDAVRTPDAAPSSPDAPPVDLLAWARALTGFEPDAWTIARPDVQAPAAVRTANGHARTRVDIQELDAPPDAEADAWTRYDDAAASGQPWTWPQLGEALGCSPDAARKRAGRRTPTPDRAGGRPAEGDPAP